ncbi:retrotransposon protein, putative, ty1-copia subclass [Tanacetum coccineum]
MVNLIHLCQKILRFKLEILSRRFFQLNLPDHRITKSIREHDCRVLQDYLLDIDSRLNKGESLPDDLLNRVKTFHDIGVIDRTISIHMKRRQQAIKGILVDGEWIDNPDRVNREFYNHFSNRFSAPDSSRVPMEGIFSRRLGADAFHDLEGDIFVDEIERRFGIVVKEFFNSSIFPNGCNFSFIALIPKITIHKAVASLKSQGMDLLGFCKKVIGNDASVAQKFQNPNFVVSFRRCPRGGIEESQFQELSFFLSSVVLSSSNNRWSWTLNGHGDFSVKSAREGIDKHWLVTSSSSTRWSKLLPIKLNVFAWHMFLDKLPTMINLSNRGLDVPCVLCPNCGNAMESRNHLFFGCSMALDLFQLPGRWWNIDITNLIDLFSWESWFNGLRLNNLQKLALEDLPSERIWATEKPRNISSNAEDVKQPETKQIDPDRLSFNIEVEEHSLGDLNEPANYKAALSDPEFEKWLVAMNEEMQSMNDNKVWKLVVLPPNAKVVKSKWIYKKKTDMDGKVYIYKARLVAKGFTQTYGVDYEETFSPVADIRAIRILIAIAAYYDYEIWQMDVKTAFLNGFLEEEIYMEQPEGFIDPNHPSKVCKLQRSIYGLKQASRSWNKRFDEEIKKFGFHQNLDEPCVYQKASGSNVIFLILYVDDIILMGNHIPSLQEVKDYLGKCFSMKDLGEAAFILGIKIYRDRSRRLIGLSQNAYLDKILKRYRMDNSKRGSIPMQVDLHLNKSQCATTSAEMKRMQNVPYASAVGSIMYAVRCTRPDVAFAQNITSRFQQNPGEAHWTAVKNILKYLRNTKDTFLVYGGNPEAELQVKCYCDAGFETDRDDTKSQTGYVFVLNGGAVVWKSSKQSTTAQHATEAEYIAASEAAKEAVWIRKFIDELGVVPSNDYPIKMNCDNSAAIIIAKESGIQKGARHFQRKYHYVRECIKTGEIDIVKVHTDENLADPFTKALAGPKLTRHARSMGLRPASSFM